MGTAIQRLEVHQTARVCRMESWFDPTDPDLKQNAFQMKQRLSLRQHLQSIFGQFRWSFSRWEPQLDSRNKPLSHERLAMPFVLYPLRCGFTLAAPGHAKHRHLCVTRSLYGDGWYRGDVCGRWHHPRFSEDSQLMWIQRWTSEYGLKTLGQTSSIMASSVLTCFDPTTGGFFSLFPHFFCDRFPQINPRTGESFETYEAMQLGEDETRNDEFSGKNEVVTLNCFCGRVLNHQDNLKVE